MEVSVVGGVMDVSVMPPVMSVVEVSVVGIPVPGTAAGRFELP